MLRGIKRLNRYENRILSIAKAGGDLVRLRQFGFSSKTKEGFRFPIYVLEIGKPKAIKKNPAGLVAGVHGLETIGIRVLLDFLDHIFRKSGAEFLKEIKSGKLSIVCIPILNPGGVALNSRSNPRGVDLMRNSGVEAIKAPPFFGGHRLTNRLPYYRGKTLEPESKVLTRFVKEYFFPVKESLIPVIDIHSGYGSIDHVWWPYANTHKECEDEFLFHKIAKHLTQNKNHTNYKFGPQSETYTIHGDLWDRLYDAFLNRSEIANPESRLLPLTLEIGTWSDLRQNPLKVLKKRGIFNPAKENKKKSIISHRKFLTDAIQIAQTKQQDWY